ncbi:MAG: RecQ family ATP-dependent DNA helicase [Spirochaetales bacterium]|nr:RecQ family ATP-dependent DNA helicase [Spirochaetales bacterium]
MGLQSLVEQLAREKLGIVSLAPLQRFVIANVLDAAADSASMDSSPDEPYRQLVLFPTGFGKTACFQLPAMLLDGLTLVIYPLLALMHDQYRRLREAGIPAALFRGELGEEEWASQVSLVLSGKARLVLTNPEMLATTRLQQLLRTQRVVHAVLDEAHCVASWGTTFRPAYLETGAIIASLQPRVISACTATAGPDMIEAIRHHVFLDQPCAMVCAEWDRPNLRYAVLPTLSPSRTLRYLLGRCPKPCIIFQRSRPGTMLMASQVRSWGFSAARYYHAGLARTERNATEAWFHASRDGILAATNAYGLGVDKKNIRTVIHTDLPDTVEAYIQEAGRGGRDGNPALAIMVAPLAGDGTVWISDGTKAEQAGSPPTRIPWSNYPFIEDCRRDFLLQQLGESATPECSGCDICTEQAVLRPHSAWWSMQPDIRRFLRAEGAFEILGFIGKNQLRFTQIEACRLLGSHGKGTWRWGGSLASWTEAERIELLQSCMKLGMVRTATRLGWKGRLALTSQGKEAARHAECLYKESRRHSSVFRHDAALKCSENSHIM